MDFPGGSVVENLPACRRSEIDLWAVRWIFGLGQYPVEGNSNPVQYSCLGNSMDRGAWLATGRPGVLQFMGSQRVGHDRVTDLI